MNLYEFVGQHPIVTVLCLAILCHTPVAIIQALKNQNHDD